MNRFILLVLCASSLFLQACLPGSPSEPKDLFPADSLSKDIASQLPTETLEASWKRTHEEEGFGHLSAVRFSGNEIHVSDLGNSKIWAFSSDGVKSELRLDRDLSFPYLLNSSPDTTLIFNAGTGSVDWFRRGSHIKSISLPKIDEGKSLMYFPAVFADKIYMKTQVAKGQAKFYQVNVNDATIEEETVLPGPSWIHQGLLRSGSQSLLSISSYYPSIYRMDQEQKLDSLRLRGFDSPMLARMHAKAMGDVDEAPLMISSAVEFDSLIFVSNLRPGWSRVDVFNTDGHLLNILEEEIPPGPTEFNTLDLDVKKDGQDYLIALIAVRQFHKTLSVEYQSTLSLHRWRRN